MQRPTFDHLVDQVGEDRVVSAEEAMVLRRAVFPDGVVDRAEADALMVLARKVADDDGAFAALVAEAIGDHVLAGDGQINDADAGWLAQRADRLTADRRARVLVDVLRRADAAPPSLAEAARNAVLAHLSGKALSAADVTLVRTLLHASAGCGAVHVTEKEVEFLFALDASSDGLAHHADWQDVFVRAVLNHLMGQRQSALLDYAAMADRRAWLEADTPFSPGAFWARALAGGFAGWKERLSTPTEVEQFEGYYETRNQEAADDARLTLHEVATLVARVRADGKRTANEEALLAEVRRLETEMAA